MRTWLQLFACQRLSDDWGIRWLNGNGNQIGFAFSAFNIAGDAGQCTASPHAGDENVNLAVGIFPDFRTGGFFVNFGVCRVAELLKQQILRRIAGDNLFCFLNGAFHAFCAFGQHQVGTQRFQQFTTFDTHGFRHGQRQFVTTCRRDIGQRDTRVAAGLSLTV